MTRTRVLAAAAALLLCLCLGPAARAEEDPLAKAKAHAQALLFSKRYVEAEAAYASLARERPRDPAVLRGLARAAYWSGDWRRAIRRFRDLEQAVPGDAEAREALAAFAILMRPVISLSGGLTDDSQPSRLETGTFGGGVWLDPLTLLQGEAGRGRFTADDLPEAVDLQRARVGVSAKLPRVTLALEAWAGAINVGGTRRLLASLTLARDLPGGWRALLGGERDAALDSAFSYLSAVPRTQLFARAARDEGALTGAAEARVLLYGDGNAGISAFSWGEIRCVSAGMLTASGGAALAWRDTRESRTRAILDASVHNGAGGDDYLLRTVFDPYVTPERQLEARLLAHVTARPAPKIRFDLASEWGLGRERATAWGPTSGFTPAPTGLAPGTYARSYRPWRVSLSADLGDERRGVRAEAVRSSGAYYTATAVTIALRSRL